jgi:hypothetical protein
MTWTLVEPCCGSACLALHLLGARAAILPYQGSKWRFRLALAARASALGFDGPPSRVVLTDPGPWGVAIGVVLDPLRRPGLVAGLRAFAEEDPASVFRRLHGAAPSAELTTFTAEFLFLQRLSFSGKAVGVRGGVWQSPGLNTSSAYGLPATDRFGAVKPMIPSMIRVLEGYARLRSAAVDARPSPAAPPVGPQPRTLVYLDPPYADSTRYPDGVMDRGEVVALAEAWRAAGAAVMVSEQLGLPLPGWERTRLYGGRGDTSPFRGKQEEWVTSAPGVLH